MAKKNLKFETNPLLSGPSMEARAKSGSPYRLLPLPEIDADPDQPRRAFATEPLAELAASIKEYGVLSPILVRITAGGTYRVIAGERRLRACKLLGLETIPAIIDADDSADQSTLAKQLVENLQRQDLAPLERAQAMAHLRDKHTWSVREIARRLGSSKSLVQRSLDLLLLPDDLQAAILQGLPETKISLLAEVKDKALRRQLIAEIDEYSRDGLRARIDALLGKSDEKVSHGGTVDKKRKGKGLSVDDKRIVEDLQQGLRTRVQLLRGKKGGQGKLVIEFYSAEDLTELYSRLMAD